MIFSILDSLMEIFENIYNDGMDINNIKTEFQLFKTVTIITTLITTTLGKIAMIILT